jgi:hypothetical protein
MWSDVLGRDAENAIRLYEFTALRLWMKRITSNIFRLHPLSRQRFKLVKRLGDPM